MLTIITLQSHHLHYPYFTVEEIDTNKLSSNNLQTLEQEFKLRHSLSRMHTKSPLIKIKKKKNVILQTEKEELTTESIKTER